MKPRHAHVVEALDLEAQGLRCLRRLFGYRQVGDNPAELLERLAGAVDRFGKPQPELPVVVELGEAEVRVRKVAQLRQNVVDGDRAVGKLLEKLP